eukprot:scaffold98599_cov59-Cyclotella_meneghiniana.AAC.1
MPTLQLLNKLQVQIETIQMKIDFFIHIKYHPDDVPRKRVQQLYQQHCGELFEREIGIKRPTIAYSRPKNLGDLITKAKLHQAPGQSSSTILGEFRNGLDPS